jgi:hypothetical protein
MLILSAKWARAVISLPEIRMGSQLATVRLKDGRKFDHVLIVEGHITKIAGNDNIPFTEDEIDQIEPPRD